MLRTDIRQVSKMGAANGSWWGSLEGGARSGLGMTGVRARPAPGSLGFHSSAHERCLGLLQDPHRSGRCRVDPKG